MPVSYQYPQGPTRGEILRFIWDVFKCSMFMWGLGELVDRTIVSASAEGFLWGPLGENAFGEQQVAWLIMVPLLYAWFRLARQKNEEELVRWRRDNGLWPEAPLKPPSPESKADSSKF